MRRWREVETLFEGEGRRAFQARGEKSVDDRARLIGAQMQAGRLRSRWGGTPRRCRRDACAPGGAGRPQMQAGGLRSQEAGGLRSQEAGRLRSQEATPRAPPAFLTA